MDEETATATVTGSAQVFDLHALKEFAPDKPVRNLGTERCVIMFLKVNPKVLR
jgi:hypothetical protein